MKKLILAFILSASLAQAQNAQPAEAPPATPPATPPVTPPAEQKPGETKPAPGGKAEKMKPFSPSDQKFAKRTSEVLQYQLKLASRASSMREKDATLATWAATKAKELTDKWTPFATLCQKHGFTDLAADISKKETGEIAKLGKVKDEKFRVEYLEMFSKEARNAHKDMENAPKMVQDPELKIWAEGIVAVLKTNADEIENKFKEEKKRK